MPKQSVFCIATSADQADLIVDRLKSANFSSDNIFAFFAEKGGPDDSSRIIPPEGPAMGLGMGEVRPAKNENILIAVHTEDDAEIARVKEICKQAGAVDLFTTGEAFAPGDSRPTDRPALPTMAAYSGSGR